MNPLHGPGLMATSLAVRLPRALIRGQHGVQLDPNVFFSILLLSTAFIVPPFFPESGVHFRWTTTFPFGSA